MPTSTSRASMLNRFRRHPRVRIPTPIACELAWRDEQRWFGKSVHGPGVVYDLSLRGMRVSTEAPIKPGDQVSLLIRLPRQAAPAEIAVATVRWAKDQIYGLAFQRLSSTSHGRLQKYMTVFSKEIRQARSASSNFRISTNELFSRRRNPRMRVSATFRVPMPWSD